MGVQINHEGLTWSLPEIDYVFIWSTQKSSGTGWILFCGMV